LAPEPIVGTLRLQYRITVRREGVGVFAARYIVLVPGSVRERLAWARAIDLTTGPVALPFNELGGLGHGDPLEVGRTVNGD
jgi:hypothetical protein